ncbi:hypothetical protein ACFTWS_33620 [Streptomyces sp. NPDC057027]|uniref:hypothetical protein n=1 Tax=Streptomyces sp. NPDC057027 TaxID=3346004 RepID=UPI00362FA844
MSARVGVAQGSYQSSVAAADALLADIAEARRLRTQLGEEPLPADERITWMEKLVKAGGAGGLVTAPDDGPGPGPTAWSAMDVGIASSQGQLIWGVATAADQLGAL